MNSVLEIKKARIQGSLHLAARLQNQVDLGKEIREFHLGEKLTLACLSWLALQNHYRLNENW